MVSYRGALVFSVQPTTLSIDRPCDACTKPCVIACPVGALTGDGYDVPTCHAHLRSAAGADCLKNGCLVRRACPVNQTYGRDPEQSGYHMRLFLK